ncbi:hypothetical protein Vadar_002706 [Vaccinium darrowii]|uniref:Uncharacterized protein n=1 Tax=Vaccinium darrowii TaxID=229202 RepID=A0ACB7XEY7_9ERIC|nr:hypothetical protein Vadar_002706 [Vaccinium darrowii]
MSVSRLLVVISQRDVVTFPGFVDCVYLEAPDELLLDNGLGDKISIQNSNWTDAVLWNPYLQMEACYKDFVCVENAKAMIFWEIFLFLTLDFHNSGMWLLLLDSLTVFTLKRLMNYSLITVWEIRYPSKIANDGGCGAVMVVGGSEAMLCVGVMMVGGGEAMLNRLSL